MSDEQPEVVENPDNQNQEAQNPDQNNDDQNASPDQQNEGENNQGQAESQGENQNEQEEDGELADQEGGENAEMGGKRKKKRRYVVKKKAKKTDFDLTANIHLNPVNYNALKDSHLQSFFVNDRVRKHLRKMYLITKEGYIVEKPEEYRRNKELLRQHYASQSVPKKTKKKNRTQEYGSVDKNQTTE